MKRVTHWLAVASFTFAIGVAASIFWQLSRRPNILTLQPPIPRGGEAAPTVDFCELLREHDKYDGKIVRVSATLSTHLEWSALFDLRCRAGEDSCAVNLYCPKEKACRQLWETIHAERNVSWDSYHLDSLSDVTVVGRFHQARKRLPGAIESPPPVFEVVEVEQIKPADLSPYLIVSPNGLRFESNYLSITFVRNFQLRELDQVLNSRPQSVWVKGKEINLTKAYGSREEDKQAERVLEEAAAVLQGQGYKVRRF